LAAGRDAHLVLVPNPSYLKGDFGIEQGEARGVATELYTYSGIAVYRAEFFADCVDGVFPLKPLMLRSMAARRCSAQLYTGPWEEIGTPERLAALNDRPGAVGSYAP
jgi:MurNAc alpha-1-phosphate uridylyltransferase